MKPQLTPSQQIWLDQTCQKLTSKLSAQQQRVGSDIPFAPIGGRYRDLSAPYGLIWWTNGFWPGMLWQMYHATGEERYAASASAAGDRLAALLDEPERLDHDVGFLFGLTAVAEYRATGREEAKERGLTAARILASRFQVPGAYILAWNNVHWGSENVKGMAIADCMMNLSLLYWASRVTGDPLYRAVADGHARTAARTIVRPDGSANHIVNFDAQDRVVETPGGQGYASGSAWGRGQGWTVYGYANAYRNTGDPFYLEVAKRSAHYCIACLAETNWLPAVDFRAPRGEERWDSTAGMILASGLLELASLVPAEEQSTYFTAAVRILMACDAKFNNWDLSRDGIVEGASLQYHDDKMAGGSVIFGDYFFTEAMLKLRGGYLQVW